MVRFSERQSLIRATTTALEMQLLLTDDEDPLDDLVTINLVDFLDTIESSRYLRRERPDTDRRSLHWTRNGRRLLYNTPEPDFRRHFRMSTEQFGAVHNRIKDDIVFVSAGKKPQAPSTYQLLVALYRFTHDGNSASAFEAGRKFGCSGERLLRCTLPTPP